MQRNLDWLHYESLHRNLALLQARSCFFYDVMLGDMVQSGTSTHMSHIRVALQSHSGTEFSFNLHELLNLGYANCVGSWTLGAVASVRVSNELGAGHPRVTKLSVLVVNGNSMIISVVLSAIVMIFGVALSKLFTTDSVVLEAVSNLIPLLAISVLLNGIQPILSGVAVGSGWQAWVAYVNLVCYYVIGLPVGCVLGFKTYLGVAGIWWGMILGVFIQTVTLIILTARTNWEAEVEKAIVRVKRASEDDTLDQLATNI